ncbi:hypothetical protein [Nocardia sp. GAS34]|uniref:hypothetical protein n=1 Tax=unclassified Nocardia TaxID=2637762 RepID=UPI003D194DE0
MHISGAISTARGVIALFGLVREVRAHRDVMGAAEQAWLTDMWPACAPDGRPVALPG